MKRFAAVFISGLLVAAVQAEFGNSSACSCGVAPERDNDFYWENDRFGMRAYGPGDVHYWSGLDVFNKAKPACSVGDILHNPGRHGNWHVTPSSGVIDNYAVGPGRGLGGVAVFGDGEWKTYPNWSAFRILRNTSECCEFELDYPGFSAAGKMTYHITLRKGDGFFSNTVTFEKPFKGAMIGPGLDLSEARGHAGSVFEDAELGIVSLFENDKGVVEQSTMTAIILDPKDAQGVKLMTDHTGCRILALDGSKTKFTYWAGALWSRRGEVKTAEAWHETVRRFRSYLIELGEGDQPAGK